MTGCLNGGSCVSDEKKQTFSCSCKQPWTGDHCETIGEIVFSISYCCCCCRSCSYCVCCRCVINVVVAVTISCFVVVVPATVVVFFGLFFFPHIQKRIIH